MGLQQDASQALGRVLDKVSGLAPDLDAGAATKAAASGSDPLDQLKKLAELREADAITPAEYDEHKRLLLAKLSRDAAR